MYNQKINPWVSSAFHCTMNPNEIKFVGNMCSELIKRLFFCGSNLNEDFNTRSACRLNFRRRVSDFPVPGCIVISGSFPLYSDTNILSNYAYT